MRLKTLLGPQDHGPFQLMDGPNLAGRDPICRIFLPGKQVSRQHAVVHLERGRVRIDDLGTPNGLLDAQGRRSASLWLSHGEKVQIGEYVLELEDEDFLEVSLEEESIDLEEELELEERTATRTSRPITAPPLPGRAPWPSHPAPTPTLLPQLPSEPDTETELELSEDTASEYLELERTMTRSTRPPSPPPAPPTLVAEPAPPRPPVTKTASPATFAPVSPRASIPPSRAPLPPASPRAPEAPRPPVTPRAAELPKEPPPIAPRNSTPPVVSPRNPAANRPTAAPKAPAPLPAVPPSPLTSIAPTVSREAAETTAPKQLPPAKPPAEVPTSPGATAVPPANRPGPIPIQRPETPKPSIPATNSENSQRASVSRLIPRPNPTPPAPVEEEPTSAGFSWILQLIAAAALLLTGALVAPGGGALALIDGAAEGSLRLSNDRGEVIALGLAEANAQRLIANRPPSVDPFDNLSGVNETYVVDDHHKVLLPESERGTMVTAKEGWIERPIRADGRTLGYVLVDYDPSGPANRSWSPLMHGLEAVIVGLVEGMLMLLLGWWLVVRPWTQLASDLRRSGKVSSPAAFGAIERVVQWLNRSR